MSRRSGNTNCLSQRPLVREKKTKGSSRLKMMIRRTRASAAPIIEVSGSDGQGVHFARSDLSAGEARDAIFLRAAPFFPGRARDRSRAGEGFHEERGS